MDSQNEKLFIVESLKAMKIYAGLLSADNLRLNQQKISQIRFLTEMMASYHCVEGYDKESDIRIHDKYLKPLDELLAGKAEQKPKFHEEHMKAIIDGLDYYQEELEVDYAPVYDQDIKFCAELSNDIKKRLLLEKLQGWEYNMQF